MYFSDIENALDRNIFLTEINRENEKFRIVRQFLFYFVSGLAQWSRIICLNTNNKLPAHRYRFDSKHVTQHLLIVKPSAIKATPKTRDRLGIPRRKLSGSGTSIKYWVVNSNSLLVSIWMVC